MQILSNNVRKPEDGDAGNVWSDALEINADLLNDLITTVGDLTLSDISKTSQTLFSANWTEVIDGGLYSGRGYKQNVLAPAGISLDNVNMRFRIISGPKTNRFIYPTIEPTSITTFDIIVNDNTFDLEIIYI